MDPCQTKRVHQKLCRLECWCCWLYAILYGSDIAIGGCFDLEVNTAANAQFEHMEEIYHEVS